MKSFIKFVLFLVAWYLLYLVINRVYAWGFGILSSVLRLDTFLGQLIAVLVSCSFLWGVLFYSITFLSMFLLDKTIYSVASMIIIGIICVLSLVIIHTPWTSVVIGIVQLVVNLLPLALTMGKTRASDNKE